MHGQHFFGSSCKLDFSHAKQCAACAIHHIGGQIVSQAWRSVGANAYFSAYRLGVKAIAHQRQQHMGMRELGQHVGLLLPIALYCGRKYHRVQGRRFELVTNRAVNGLGV